MTSTTSPSTSPGTSSGTTAHRFVRRSGSTPTRGRGRRTGLVGGILGAALLLTGTPAVAGDGLPGGRRIVDHTVRAGETATGLAVRYHAWTAELISHNHLGSSATLHVGQHLEIPVVVAALRGRMLGLAAEVAEGTFTNLLPLSGVPQVVEAFGAPDKELACRFFCVPQPEDEGLAFAKFMFVAYATVPVYAAFYRWLGWGERIEPMVEAWNARERQRALELVPDELVREIYLFGSPAQMRERLRQRMTSARLLLLSPEHLHQRVALQRSLAQGEDHQHRELAALLVQRVERLIGCARPGGGRNERKPAEREQADARAGLSQLLPGQRIEVVDLHLSQASTFALAFGSYGDSTPLQARQAAAGRGIRQCGNSSCCSCSAPRPRSRRSAALLGRRRSREAAPSTPATWRGSPGSSRRAASSSTGFGSSTGTSVLRRRLIGPCCLSPRRFAALQALIWSKRTPAVARTPTPSVRAAPRRSGRASSPMAPIRLASTPPASAPAVQSARVPPIHREAPTASRSHASVSPLRAA